MQDLKIKKCQVSSWAVMCQALMWGKYVAHSRCNAMTPIFFARLKVIFDPLYGYWWKFGIFQNLCFKIWLYNMMEVFLLNFLYFRLQVFIGKCHRVQSNLNVWVQISIVDFLLMVTVRGVKSISHREGGIFPPPVKETQYFKHFVPIFSLRW